jgi:hypothetical protein
MKSLAAFFIFTVAAFSASYAHAQSANLVVHEWGTFTSFQDSGGATISGINVDDEPVPKFVHRLDDIPVFTTRSTPAHWSQGAPRCHPDVTLRLETPVLYFYPHAGFSTQQAFDVRATFIGGWLTEFFPFAEAGESGFPAALDSTTRGSLQWSGLTLTEGPGNLSKTTEYVWIAPRAVRSAVVTQASQQESEKYLFYRGVGHLDAPLVARARDHSLDISLRKSELKQLPAMWLVRVQPDGRVRYRQLQPGENQAVNASFPAADQSTPSDLAALRRELTKALVAEGLFLDEALAMLETWQLSYFESEGTRLMFVLPRAWTDSHLPLSISVPADITRVMLGRLELVSPYQRARLRRLLELPDSAFNRTPLYAESPTVLRNLQTSSASPADLYRSIGREVPESLQLYDSLGRFRDALLVHEWHSTSDAAVRARLKLVLDMYGACEAQLSAP